MSVRVDVTTVAPGATGLPEALRTAWTTLAAECPEASPYASPGIAEAVRATCGLGYRVAVAERKNRVCGALIAFAEQRGPFALRRMPPYVGYLPLLLPERERTRYAATHERSDVLSALLSAVCDGADRCALHLPPEVADVRGPVWDGFGATPLYTFARTLEAEAEAYVAAWSATSRNLWRRNRTAFTIRRTESAAELARLSAASYMRHDRAAVDAAPLAAALVERGCVRVYEAVREGRVEAAAGFLSRGDRAGFWLAGSERGPAMTVLLGETAPLLHAAGLRHLDLLGANTPSIAEFKRSQGGTLVPYYRLTRTTSRALRALEMAGRSVG